MNALKTMVLMVTLTLMLVFIGGLIGGKSGLTMALIMAFGLNFVTYWFSDRIVLKMYGAREIGQTDSPELYLMVKRLSLQAGLPMPKVYIIDKEQPNAFATGRNPEHGAVAVTTGLMRALSREELEGVIGHELAHIKHRDILVGTVAASIAGAISYLAQIAGNPLYLARALKKLHLASQRIPLEANPATSHMFIVNPLSGGGIVRLFSTHPPIEQRIARLEALRSGA